MSGQISKLESAVVAGILLVCITVVVWMAGNEMADRGAAEMPPESVTLTLDPCTTEDSIVDCYWDATLHGDGTSRSFIVYDGYVYLSTNEVPE